jgi:hypothetical protein
MTNLLLRICSIFLDSQELAGLKLMYLCQAYHCLCNTLLLSLLLHTHTQGFIQKFLDWPPGARTANATALCHYVQLYCYFVSQCSEFCHHNPSCCFSTSNTKGINLVWKLLDTPLCVCNKELCGGSFS